MKNKNFIKTSDEETAKLLRNSGLYELAKEGNFWVFVNSDKINFSSEEMKVNYSDRLCF